MQAYSYIRWSSPQQSLGHSKARQTDKAALWAEKHKVLLDNSTYQDHGVSAFKGLNLVEGKLGAFLKAVDEGHIETPCYLIVEALDRITRVELLSALHLFISIIQRNVVIVTLADEIQFSTEAINAPGGELLLFGAMFHLVRANHESSSRGARVKAAWDENREQQKHGIIASKMCPSWLTVREDRRGHDKIKWKVDIVKKIYKLALKGHGGHKITKMLNDDNVPMIGRKKGRWTVGNVSKMLCQPAVYGLFVQTRGPLRIEGYYPTIISKKDYDAVQSARIGRRGSGGWNQGVSNLFSKITRCAYCGDRFKYTTSGPPGYRTVYLRCLGAEVHSCDARALRYLVVESELLTYLSAHMRIDLRSHELDASTVSYRRELEQDAHAKQGELDRLAKALLRAPDVEVIADMMQSVQTELNDIKAKLANLDHSAVSANELDVTVDLMYAAMEDRDNEIRLKLQTALRRQIKEIQIASYIHENPKFLKQFGVASKPKSTLHMARVVYFNGAESVTDIIVGEG
jgi:DNA invertase Pin-like site-specific DNA recombinase